METERARVVSRAGGGQGGWLVFNGERVSVWEIKKFCIWTEGGDGCTTVQMYVMPHNHTLKNG